MVLLLSFSHPFAMPSSVCYPFAFFNPSAILLRFRPAAIPSALVPNLRELIVRWKGEVSLGDIQVGAERNLAQHHHIQQNLEVRQAILGRALSSSDSSSLALALAFSNTLASLVSLHYRTKTFERYFGKNSARLSII